MKIARYANIAFLATRTSCGSINRIVKVDGDNTIKTIEKRYAHRGIMIVIERTYLHDKLKCKTRTVTDTRSTWLIEKKHKKKCYD